MKWLVLTDNKSFHEGIEKTLLELDKKTKCVCLQFNIEALSKQKKNFKEFTAAVIYSAKPEIFTAPRVALLSSITGYFVAKGINIISNIEFLYNNPLFEKDSIHPLKSDENIIAYIKKNYNALVDKAVKRIAKGNLLERGIPFTADCMATYIAKNKIEIFEEFLEAGMSVNSRDDTGTPMLNIACRNDNFEIVERLLSLGAELNAVSEDRGYTAVMDAVWRGNEKITKFLIEKGADLNTISKEGQSNLVLAVGADRYNICKLLVENGSDPDVKDMMGMSAYGYATLFKKEKIAEILRPYHKEG